jgi:hypothetical protein
MKVTLSARSITALQKLITGDDIKAGVSALAPYRGGPALVTFFNEFAGNDSYGQGFPSRWKYAEDKLQSHNGTKELTAIIEAALEPDHFFDTSFTLDAAVDYLNRYLDRDGYTVVVSGKKCRMETNTGLTVEAESVLPVRDPLSHEFIREQTDKCDKKVSDGDYDGAITNARSLIEAVLYEIEGRLAGDQQPYDGDLQKLYKRTQKLLNLDPEKAEISESLKMVLRGLSSIVAGIAPLRNKMADAHVRTYKPERHHAKLAVNSAKTLTDFLIDTLEYQERTGRIAASGR